MSSFNREDTHHKIVSIIAKKLQLNPSQIQEQATLQDLGADSLDIVEIIILIEEQLGVMINEADAQQLHTVADVVTYVHGLRKK